MLFKIWEKNTSLSIWAKLPILGPKIGALPGTCRAWDHPHLKEKPKRKRLKKKKIEKGSPCRGTLSPMESRIIAPQRACLHNVAKENTWIIPRKPSQWWRKQHPEDYKEIQLKLNSKPNSEELTFKVKIFKKWNLNFRFQTISEVKLTFWKNVPQKKRNAQTHRQTENRTYRAARRS